MSAEAVQLKTFDCSARRRAVETSDTIPTCAMVPDPTAGGFSCRSCGVVCNADLHADRWRELNATL